MVVGEPSIDGCTSSERNANEALLNYNSHQIFSDFISVSTDPWPSIIVLPRKEPPPLRQFSHPRHLKEPDAPIPLVIHHCPTTLSPFRVQFDHHLGLFTIGKITDRNLPLEPKTMAERGHSLLMEFPDKLTW